MTENDLMLTVGRLGWKREVDEVGDVSFVLELDDRIVMVMPDLGKRSDHYRVSFSPRVTTHEFVEAISYLTQEREGYDPIFLMREDTRKVASLSEDDVREMLEEVVDWAKSVVLEKGYAAYRNLPTDSVGARPLWHLAALALGREVDKLSGYLANFKSGNRMGFVPYINEGILERAVAFSKNGSEGG
ncbi:DUF6990 domain-containing protein [Ralstonia pseudosolanacearum]